MLNQPWQAAVRRIVDGMPVNASTINAPLTDLARRDDYLKAVLSALNYGEAIMAREVPVSALTTLGSPVYLNTETGLFEPALSAVDFSSVGEGVVAKTAYVWGVVSHKYTATTADITLAGMLRGVDMTGVIDDPTESGPYYLSSATPGKLTLQRQPISVHVLYWWASEQIALIMPTPRELLEGHIHYRFELEAAPAGVHNAPTRTGLVAQKQAVLTPSLSVKGWLPASSLTGAPAEAKFGYNLAQHPELNSVFPPIPLDSCYVEVIGGLRGTGRSLLIDQSGIWWTEDDYGYAPWSPDLPDGLVDVGVANSTLPIPPELVDPDGDNPWTEYPLRVVLWFTKMVYKTSESAVTSLTTPAGSALVIENCITGDPATRGDLSIRLQLELATAADLEQSDLGLVRFNDSNQLVRGYRVSNITTDTPGSIEILGTEWDDPATTKKTGSVKVNYIGDQADRYWEPAIAALDNVREEQYSDVYFLGFLQNRTSALRLKYELPAILPGAAVTMEASIRLRVIGTVLGVMPALHVSGRIIPAASTITALPAADVALEELDLTTLNGGSAVPAHSYVDIVFPLNYESSGNPVEVQGGDTLYVEFSRVSGEGAYAGTVGLMRYPLMLS